ALALGPLYRNIKSVVSTKLYTECYCFNVWNGIRIYAKEQDVDDTGVLKDSRKIQEIASSLLPTSCSKVTVSMLSITWSQQRVSRLITTRRALHSHSYLKV
ncbi:hypothetical protein T265_13114, partial [Opisthorchis viverrini]